MKVYIAPTESGRVLPPLVIEFRVDMNIDWKHVLIGSMKFLPALSSTGALGVLWM